MTNIQLFSGQIKKGRVSDVYQKGIKKVEQTFKQKVMNVFSKEDYFHKINYNWLSVLDNKPVLYCIVLYCIDNCIVLYVLYCIDNCIVLYVLYCIVCIVLYCIVFYYIAKLVRAL